MHRICKYTTPQTMKAGIIKYKLVTSQILKKWKLKYNHDKVHK